MAATVIINDAYDEVGVAEAVTVEGLTIKISAVQAVGHTESVSLIPDKQISVADVISIAEYKNLADSKNVSVVDSITVAESKTVNKKLTALPGTNVITLQGMGVDTQNWIWSDSFPGNKQGIKVFAVVVMAAGADTFILRANSTTGPIWFTNVSTGAEYKVVQISALGLLLKPVMVAAEQTLNVGSRYAILFEKP